MKTILKVLLKILRQGLGQLIVWGDLITRKSPVKRSKEEQHAIQQACESLSLYQFKACPFCVKVRREMHHLGLPIETRDVKSNPSYETELATQGGSSKVPCLKIESPDTEPQWLYESNDIIAYLRKRFSSLADQYNSGESSSPPQEQCH